MKSIILLFIGMLAASACAKNLAADAASRAAEALAAGDYPKAEAEARRAVEAKPSFAEAWVGLGFALFRQEKKAEAKAAFESALRAHQSRYREKPSDWNQLFQQVFVLSLLGRDSEAIDVLRDGKSRFPDQQAFTIPEGQIADFRRALHE